MSTQTTPPSGGTQSTLYTILAFIFGVVFLAAILAIAVLIPNPTNTQMIIFRIVIALAAGGAAAIIPGFIDLNLSRGQTFALRAGGALAVFAIVYFFDPGAQLKSITTEEAKAKPATPEAAKPGSKSTQGDGSPIIEGNSGPVRNDVNIQNKR